MKRERNPEEPGVGPARQRMRIAEPGSLPLGNIPCVCIPAILDRIASFLPPNEVVLLRRVSKPWREPYDDRKTFRMSEAVPPEVFKEKWQLMGSCKHLTLEEREKLSSLVAASNCVANLEVALAATGLTPRPQLLTNAAAAGAITTCAYLLERLPEHFIDTESFVFAAAKNGHGAVVDFGLKHNPSGKLTWAAARGAAEGGHTVLSREYLRHAIEVWKQRSSSRSSVASEVQALMISALGGCTQPYSKELQDSFGCPEARSAGDIERWDDLYICEAMSAALFSDTADWEVKAVHVLMAVNARGQGHDVDLTESYGSDRAFRMGTAAMERFEWLKAQGYLPAKAKFPASLLQAAVTGRHTAAVQWLLDEGLAAAVEDERARSRLIELAAGVGNAGALKAMQEAGWALDPVRIVDKAAAGGHVHVLSWAWESFGWSQDRNGLTVVSFLSACSSGSVEAMRWVHQRLGRHDGVRHAWGAVALSGCEAAAELLAELGCAQPLDGRPYAIILEDSRTTGKWCPWWMFHCLHRLGVAFGPAGDELVAQAVDVGVPLGTLRWLLDQGCPEPDWEEVREAVFGRSVCGPDWCEAEADTAEVMDWVDSQ